MSVSTVCAELVPKVTTTLFTYWCLSGSVDCFPHFGFLVSTICLFGV